LLESKTLTYSGEVARKMEVQIAVRLPDDLVRAMDDYAASTLIPPTRQQIIRIALSQFLEREGAFSPKPPPKKRKAPK
jgi:predicted transcriptional regulator